MFAAVALLASKTPGPVAHLVECRHGMAEVTGSIPVGSTDVPHQHLRARMLTCANSGA